MPVLSHTPFCLRLCADVLTLHCRHDKKLGRDRVFLQAKRDIPAGTEIFVSYGSSYWRMRDMPPTVVLADQPAQLQAEATSTDTSTSAHSSGSLDSKASSISSIDPDYSTVGDATSTDRKSSDIVPAGTAVDDTVASCSMDFAEPYDSSTSTSQQALSTSTYNTSMQSRMQEPQAHSMPAQQAEHSVQQQQQQHMMPQQRQQGAGRQRTKHYRSTSAGWQVELLRFGRMSIADMQADAVPHPSTQDQLAANVSSQAADVPPLGSHQKMRRTPTALPSTQHAGTARRALSCRHEAPLRQDTGVHNMQWQPYVKPSTPGSAFKTLSTRRMLPGLGAMSLTGPIGAGMLAFSASPAAHNVNDRDDRDPCWSPPNKAKKHMQQQLQDLEQQGRARSSMQRPQRRRRMPDPNLQYNGTMQAAKPIHTWW